MEKLIKENVIANIALHICLYRLAIVKAKHLKPEVFTMNFLAHVANGIFLWYHSNIDLSTFFNDTIKAQSLVKLAPMVLSFYQVRNNLLYSSPKWQSLDSRFSWWYSLQKGKNTMEYSNEQKEKLSTHKKIRTVYTKNQKALMSKVIEVWWNWAQQRICSWRLLRIYTINYKYCKVEHRKKKTQDDMDELKEWQSISGRVHKCISQLRLRKYS